MSYKIRYQQHRFVRSFSPQFPRLNYRKFIWLLSVIVIVASACALRFDSVRRYLLPGNPEVTEAALTGFVADLKNGESVDAAVVAFCQEIIDNADIS